MATSTLIAGLPPELELTDGYIIRLTAIDATTGADVAGVVVNNAAIYAQNVGGGSAGDLASGPFLLVPGPGA